jgi:tetratricopeptide (TPR) repeat protein
MCALVGVFTHESGDSETAEKTFEECLTEYPNSGVVVKQAVDFFDDTERPERGNEILRAVVARSPERSDARALLAERLRASGAAEEAEQILRAGTEIDASPAPWISLTLHYEALKDPARAREAMEQALQRMPRVPPDVIFAYADICVRAGAYDEALAQVAKLEWPGFAPLIRGRVAFERGDYATALREFDTGIQTWPDNPGLRQLAGRAAEQLGNFDRAIAEYREALRTESAATDAGLDLARLYEAMGNPGGAFTALALHHKMHPNDPDALERSIPLVARAGLEDTVKAQVEALRKFGSPARAVAARADLALRAGKPERAVELVRAASLDLDAAENDPALRVLTRALLDAGRVEEAQRIVEAAVRARPQDPGCLALWGGTLEADAPAAARAAFQRALDADPDHAAARVGMARLEARGSDDDAALRSYGLALAADAENADAAWGAIAIVEARGDAAEFERRLRARLRANPRDGKAALKLAQLLLASKPDAARELARRAALLGTGPESAETLASAQLALGRPDAAIEVLETVIERHPERAAARYRLGLAQAAAGNSRAAATALREALDTGGFPEVDDARQRLAALESASATP